MKQLFLIGFYFFSCFSFSQESGDDQKVQNLVKEFFEAFHNQDSAALNTMAHKNVVLQSIAVSSEGNSTLTTTAYPDFVKAIIALPSETKFEEKLHGFDVTVNGNLANVTTPYSFFVNNELSHCGVNSFQLMKKNGTWKIIYLVDTRTKTGCENY